MEFGFYIVIFILIMLKLLIWVCVIYSRAQRRRRLLAAIDAAANNPRVIIVERVACDGNYGNHGIHNDYGGGVDNPALAQWGLPSYEQARQMQSKPPPYEQVVCSPTGQQGSSSQPAWSGVRSHFHQTTLSCFLGSRQHQRTFQRPQCTRIDQISKSQHQGACHMHHLSRID